jgi:mono/diheme cytochrome c family protein
MFVSPLTAPGVRAVGKAGLAACAALLALAWAGLRWPGAENAARASALSPKKKQAVRGHYRRFCSRCHGGDYTGEPGRTPDFTSRSWHGRRSDTQLLVSILEGKGRGMPAHRGKLSEGQARDLVAYLREVGGVETSGRADPGDFTRRFEELEKELRELKRQFREAGSASGKPAREE